MKQKIKEEQKKLAQKIRESKPDNKHYSWEFRHRHIVYCQLFNNTPYSLIEKPAENNAPNQSLLDRYRNEWAEALCSNS